METPELPSRVKFVSHTMRRMLLLDLTLIENPKDALDTVDYARSSSMDWLDSYEQTS